MLRVLRELLIPFIILLFTILYWGSLKGAPDVAVRVPRVAVGVIGVLLVLTLFKIYTELRAVRHKSVASPEPGASTGNWFSAHRAQLLLIILSIAYYLLFDRLGFNMANILFMLATLPAVGYWRGRSVRAAVSGTIIISAVTSVVLYVLAHVMDLNVPTSALGF